MFFSPGAIPAVTFGFFLIFSLIDILLPTTNLRFDDFEKLRN